VTPYVLVEQVEYSNASPWPSGANATGLSLQRAVPGNFGDDPGNWQIAAPTAGRLNSTQNPDQNGDGLPDEWQVRYFGSASNPDHDGLTNLQEYRAGTNPTDASSSLNLILARQNGEISDLQFNGIAGRTYTVWYCDNLTLGTWTQLTSVAAQTQDGLVHVSDPAIGIKTRFYRLSTP
jgi:hypothetical protein